jgi:hypothetical protein
MPAGATTPDKFLTFRASFAATASALPSIICERVAIALAKNASHSH